jgi:hypothetical protein
MCLPFRCKCRRLMLVAQCDTKGEPIPTQHDLPAHPMAQIGRTVTLSAKIEQQMILWANALHAQDTAGVPAEDLRMDFKRLREVWYSAASAKLPPLDVTNAAVLRRL